MAGDKSPASKCVRKHSDTIPVLSTSLPGPGRHFKPAQHLFLQGSVVGSNTYPRQSLCPSLDFFTSSRDTIVLFLHLGWWFRRDLNSAWWGSHARAGCLINDCRNMRRTFVKGQLSQNLEWLLPSKTCPQWPISASQTLLLKTSESSDQDYKLGNRSNHDLV